jgi:hypothetical protein
MGKSGCAVPRDCSDGKAFCQQNLQRENRPGRAALRLEPPSERLALAGRSPPWLPSGIARAAARIRMRSLLSTSRSGQDIPVPYYLGRIVSHSDRGKLSGFLHPEGVALFSPGQRPGNRKAVASHPSPERARQARTPRRSSALSGRRGWRGLPFPGRCPGLNKATPAG